MLRAWHSQDIHKKIGVGLEIGAATGAFIEHWNGSSWSLLNTPSGVAELNGVTALSDGTVVAVGDGTNSAVILHN